jgi:hypothetical protein
MRYLGDRHVGFDPQELGFPSLDGCQGIVYVTDAGLFGFHNLGGAAKVDWEDRAKAFALYVSGHPQGNSPGRALYGACYAPDRRGYGTTDWKTMWRGELTEIASRLGFTGKIYGGNLTQAGIANPALAEFTKVGNTCVLQAKQWSDAGATKAPNDGSYSHKTTYRANTNAATIIKDLSFPDREGKLVVTKIFTTVPRGNFTTIYPEQLR